MCRGLKVEDSLLVTIECCSPIVVVSITKVVKYPRKDLYDIRFPMLTDFGASGAKEWKKNIKRSWRSWWEELCAELMKEGTKLFWLFASQSPSPKEAFHGLSTACTGAPVVFSAEHARVWCTYILTQPVVGIHRALSRCIWFMRGPYNIRELSLSVVQFLSAIFVGCLLTSRGT